MVTRKPAWQKVILPIIVLFCANVQSLPITSSERHIDVTEIVPVTEDVVFGEDDVIKVSEEEINNRVNLTGTGIGLLAPRIDENMLRSVRPGQTVVSYEIEITPNGDRFEATAIIQVRLTEEIDDGVKFHVEDLDIHSIQYGFANLNNAIDLHDYGMDEGVLEIWLEGGSSYVFLIQYEGNIRNDGHGLYRGVYDDNSYLAMNLNPTFARRVFPCMDEPTATTTISFNFNNGDYNSIIANSVNDGNTENADFNAIPTPTHLWGLIAHNLVNILSPGDRLRLYGRAGVSGQDSYASVMTQSIINFLNEYTDKNYFEIDDNQETNLHIFALPDITHDWNSLSTVGIWEPYILMETTHSVKQQKTALMAMAEAYARQWFGYVIYPENWRFAWITTGLSIHAAYEAAREADVRLDMDEVYLADLLQESLLRDAYTNSQVLEVEEDLSEEDQIRYNLGGILKYKAPAIIRMLQLVLGDNDDYIQSGARALLTLRTLDTVTPQNFFDSINNDWFHAPDKLIENIGEFLEPWLTTTGYPVVNVQLRTGGLFITQERFGFSARDFVNYNIPLTYTTSVNPDFEDIYSNPDAMMESSSILTMLLPEEEWVIFNIQAQGYYRVNYDEELWERLIEALSEPEDREIIHPLNRASLVDDALNLARGGKLSYDIAFRVVLTLELETNYAVWRAFVRNMEFIRKRLMARLHHDEDEEFDRDIYLRMVRRTIHAIEEEFGFSPDPMITEDGMVSLTRGLVMDHACRANYIPCIAAAVDWFYDANTDVPTVNPNIPNDLRPAVYCTMVRDGDEAVIEALWNRFDDEDSHYERVVIIESLACTNDDDLLRDLLFETLDGDGRIPMKERSKFLMAVMQNSYQHAELALNFFRTNVNTIRDMYGGPVIVEEMLYVLSENLADFDLTDSFDNWVSTTNNNLEESFEIAERVLEHARENLAWNEAHLDDVYEWINENHATGITASIALLFFSICIALFNR